MEDLFQKNDWKEIQGRDSESDCEEEGLVVEIKTDYE